MRRKLYSKDGITEEEYETDFEKLEKRVAALEKKEVAPHDRIY